MNRIKTLSAKNLKGRSFSYDLAPLNIIVGDNEVGKTAVLDAVVMNLLGYKLKPGKPPLKSSAAIFRSCGCRGGGATELDLQAELTDGQTIHRNWAMKRGKISYTGPDNEWIPPLLLDPTGFFAISGPERRNHVLRQCDLSALGLGYKPLLQKLDKIEYEPALGEDGKVAVEAVKLTINQLETARAEEDVSIYDWLSSVVESITALRDQAKALAETHEETIKGLTDGKAQDADMTAIQSVQPELNDMRASHTAAVQAEANALNQFNAAAKELQDAKALAATQVDETATRNQISAQEQFIAKAKEVPAPGDRPTEQTMQTPRPNVLETHKEWYAKDNAARLEARKASDIMLRITLLKTQIEEARARTTCPTCGHDITTQQAKIVADLESSLKTHLNEYQIQQTLCDDARAAAITAQDVAKRVENDIATWDAEASRLRALNQTMLDAWTARHRGYTDAQTKINRTTAEIARLQASLTSNAAAHDAWVKLPMLEASTAELAKLYQIAKSEVPSIQETIRQLEVRQRQFIARTQDQRRADQSRQMLKQAQERLTVFKAALKLVAGEKERAAADAFGALLKHARLFTDGNLRAPLEYRDGEIGMTFEGNWIEVGEFSGKQQIFALAGLGVALTQDNKGLRIVLVDEMGRLTEANKQKLIDRLLELIDQDIIDQAFLCDVSAESYFGIVDANLIYVA